MVRGTIPCKPPARRFRGGALAGIAAVCDAPIGEGERRHYRKEDRTPEFPSSTSEHQLLGISGNPLGAGLTRAMIWDGMWSLDYLQRQGDIRGNRHATR